MATAKETATATATAKEAILKEELQLNQEFGHEVAVENGKLYKFESNGKSPYLKKGRRYLLTAELYKLFVKKGYGK